MTLFLTSLTIYFVVLFLLLGYTQTNHAQKICEKKNPRLPALVKIDMVGMSILWPGVIVLLPFYLLLKFITWMFNKLLD